MRIQSTTVFLPAAFRELSGAAPGVSRPNSWIAESEAPPSAVAPTTVAIRARSSEGADPVTRFFRTDRLAVRQSRMTGLHRREESRGTDPGTAQPDPGPAGGRVARHAPPGGRGRRPAR